MSKYILRWNQCQNHFTVTTSPGAAKKNTHHLTPFKCVYNKLATISYTSMMGDTSRVHLRNLFDRNCSSSLLRATTAGGLGYVGYNVFLLKWNVSSTLRWFEPFIPSLFFFVFFLWRLRTQTLEFRLHVVESTSAVQHSYYSNSISHLIICNVTSSHNTIGDNILFTFIIRGWNIQYVTWEFRS